MSSKSVGKGLNALRTALKIEIEQLVLDGAILTVYETPEFTLAAQISALEEDIATVEKEIARLEKFAASESSLVKEQEQHQRKLATQQNALILARKNLKKDIESDPKILEQIPRLGQWFDKFVENVVAASLKESEAYRKELVELKAMMEKAESIQADIEAEAKEKSEAADRAVLLTKKNDTISKKIARMSKKLAKLTEVNNG